MILLLLLIFIDVSLGKLQYFDTYTGKPICLDEFKQHVQRNTTFWCTIEVDDECDPDDWRRLDGSCNNLNEITRGATHTPFYKLMPSVFEKDFEPRKSVSGNDLPLARVGRTSCLFDGRVPDQQFTQLLTYFWLFMTVDSLSSQDSVNFVLWKTQCCTPKGKTDYECTPNKVPVDDPVHQFSGIRCLNMTRPISFQSSGCLPNNTIPERVDSGTPPLDLSLTYGSNLNDSLKGRLYEGGLLKYEVENEKIWPPSVTDMKTSVCYLNQGPKETRCHATPEVASNGLLGMNLFTIWFWRQHNKIANELAVLNPHWDDNRLFYEARDINIAIAVQMFYYEMLPAVMGEENLIRDNITTKNPGFRDMYDPNLLPQTSLEYPYVLRWVHTILESTVKMYDSQGCYLKQVPMVNLTIRTGYLPVDNNIDHITQGAFRQPCGKVDYIVHPDLTGNGLPFLQRSVDVLTNDLGKGRYFGFQPYVKYREFCTGRPHKTWEDLAYLIDPERIEILKDLYESPKDIDLLAGIWLEKLIDGGSVPVTFYCLVKLQLIRNMVSDRHFYERPNRPHAFTLEQLQEIRKASIARMMCDVGDSVTEIQPQAFLRIGPGNELCDCSDLPKINLSAWQELM